MPEAERLRLTTPSTGRPKAAASSQIGWFQATARTPGVTCKTLQTAPPASRRAAGNGTNGTSSMSNRRQATSSQASSGTPVRVAARDDAQSA